MPQKYYEEIYWSTAKYHKDFEPDFFVVMEIETKGLKCIVTNGNSGRKNFLDEEKIFFSNLWGMLKTAN